MREGVQRPEDLAVEIREEGTADAMVLFFYEEWGGTTDGLKFLKTVHFRILDWIFHYRRWHHTICQDTKIPPITKAQQESVLWTSNLVHDLVWSDTKVQRPPANLNASVWNQNKIQEEQSHSPSLPQHFTRRFSFHRHRHQQSIGPLPVVFAPDSTRHTNA